MKFINRKREIEFIRECKDLSKSKLFSLCIFGLRRVGKTRLILEFLGESDLYFFVNKDKRSESLLKEYEEFLKNKGILTALESIKNWDDFFDVIFRRYKGTLVFDEFQNFVNVDKSVFGILQKNIDLHENKKDIFIIFSGSTIGLIKKIFFDRKEPLYGRLKRRMNLKPLLFSDVVAICNELGIKDIEDVITLYILSGGIPKYYVAIEDEKLGGKLQEILDKFFFVENAVFEDEANTILSLEFGKRKGVYYDILSAIANGSTRISEVASYLGKKETALTRQINELINYFNIVGVKKQVCGKKTLMFIEHPLINFWFCFFYKNLSQYKRRERSLIENIKKSINSYVGKKFEEVCEEILTELKIVPFEFTKIGKQWGKIPNAPKDKNQYEIDIAALNEKTKEILFCECKWKEQINAEQITKELNKKAEYVDWNNNKRKEYFAVFAKSFSKKIKEFEGKRVYCFDLKDIETALKK